MNRVVKFLKNNALYTVLSMFFAFFVFILLHDFYQMVIVNIEPRIWGSEAFAAFGWVYESRQNYAIRSVLDIVFSILIYAISFKFYKKNKKLLAYLLLFLPLVLMFTLSFFEII